MKKSKKQQNLEKKILEMLKGKPAKAANIIFNNRKIQYIQDYANIVSIKRLGYNDHGPVHMCKTALNAMIMFELLHNSNIKFNLEKENIGTVEDSKSSVLIASLLHDVGMTTSRDNHEIIGTIIAYPIVENILEKVYPANIEKQVVVKSVILEGILGHMGTQRINSLEAGLVLIGDGCDMEKGRSRIPILLYQKPRLGDIHKYSSRSINAVKIEKGTEKPIKITIEMNHSVGVYQIEEVLFPKIESSPIKHYIELYGKIRNQKPLKYL